MANPRYNKQTTNTRVRRSSGSPKSGEKPMKQKYKGFSKLPERVQKKINKDLAKKV
jgi:hypothetical protein